MLLLVKLHKIHYNKKEDVPFLSEIAVSMPWNMIVFLSGLAVIICWKWLQDFFRFFLWKALHWDNDVTDTWNRYRHCIFGM